MEEAAQLGSEFARMQLVQANPIAALCSDTLNDLLSQYSLPRQAPQ